MRPGVIERFFVRLIPLPAAHGSNILALVLLISATGANPVYGQNGWALSNPGADARTLALDRFPALADAYEAVRAYRADTELIPAAASTFENCVSWDPMVDCLGDDPDCWRGHNCGAQLLAQRLALLKELEQARDRLTSVSDVPAEVLDWFNAQEVSLSFWVGDEFEAERRAADCRGSMWLCEVLPAYVAARTGNLQLAEERFAAALERMPEDMRCHWAHPAPLAEAAAPFRASCTDAERAWALIDPLFSTQLNERRLEHWSRLTELVFHSQRLEAVGVLCPPNHHITVLRHGWLVGRQSGGSVAPLGQPQKFGPGENLVPSGIFADPFAGGPARWRPTLNELERSQSLGGPLAEIGAQAGIVQREESQIVFLKTAGITGARAFARDGTHEVELPMAASPGGVGGLARIPSGGTVLSLEATPPDNGVYRWRTGLALQNQAAGGISLSSLFMLEHDAGQPSSDSALLVSMLATDTASHNLALYWETYTLESLPVKVTVEAHAESRGGLWHRVRRLFGAGEPTEVQVTWNDQIAAGMERHYLDIALSPDAEGAYLFTVRVNTGTNAEAQTEVRLWIY